MAATTHPVRTLRELATRLEAAVTQVVADPGVREVHQLRTLSRRIEAQLELLSLLPGLPRQRHKKDARKTHKLLRRLRRAAGRVRDLDVQQDLTQARSKDADRLCKQFRRQREEDVERLLETIRKYQPRLTAALEDLLKTLQPVEAMELPVSRLCELTMHWYIHNVPATARDAEELHSIRKSAKLARYIAESAIPAQGSKKATPARHLARTFEALQHSGGEWHDWLTLSEIAHQELGASSRLTQSFARRCERSLTAYRRHLKSLPKDFAANKKSAQTLVD
jgi:CHAD domain-containing protein